MKPYKILVVDDSAFMRKMITDMIADHAAFEVVGTAKNGQEAIEKIKRLKPSAVTLDVEMPVMNGLQALQWIKAEYPLPVLMISSLTQDGAQETIDALALGAFDFVSKPSGPISLDIGKLKEELHQKLYHAVQAKNSVTVIRDKRAHEPVFKRTRHIHSNQFEHIVAIGTSTGGPRALNEVISRLPADFPAPILIVQHMPPKFTKSLAMRLNTISKIHVVEAEDAMPVQSGVAYVAPGGTHMKIEKTIEGSYRIVLNDGEFVEGHRPSVDVLFHSLVPYHQLKRHAVIMTGMGKDGAVGMSELKRAGAVTTIAEDEHTCIVYGMPKAAIQSGSVDLIMPVHKISDQLIRIVNNQ